MSRLTSEWGRRSIVITLLAFMCAIALVGQLGNLTLIQRASLIDRIPKNDTAQFRVDAPRGNILARDGRPLATNRPASVAYIRHPHYLDREVLDRLAHILELDPEELYATAQRRAKEGPLWEPLRVKSDISRAEHARLLEEQASLPGVTVAVEGVRQYPEGALVGHIIGYVGAISPSEWDKAKADPWKYQPDDIIGKAGLEAQYEKELRGQPGVNQVEVDTAWRPIGAPIPLSAPTQGDTLVLTLDLRLQQAAEQALAWTIFRIANTPHTHRGRSVVELHEATAGALVVLDVKTGAILAMASYPTYDPNLFITRRPLEDFLRIQQDPLAPQWHRAIRAQYFAGSTFKMVTATGVLAEKLVSPRETFLSTGIYEPTGQAENVSGGYGAVDMYRALQKSSNVYFYEMGRRLTADGIEKYARMYGFGSLTGVDLPDEASGYVLDKSQRDLRGWYLGDTTSAAIGQVFQVTPLQLARYAAAIASGGQVLRPYLVQEIRSADGTVKRQTVPEVQQVLEIDPKLLQVIQQGMRLVDSEGGTSDMHRWALPGLKTAGKTGTAQYQGRDDFGLFVGYAPFEDPEIAVAVAIEQGGHGQWVGPAARAMYAAYFNLPLQPGDPALVPADFPANAEAIAQSLRRTGRYITPGMDPTD